MRAIKIEAEGQSVEDLGWLLFALAQDLIRNKPLNHKGERADDYAGLDFVIAGEDE